MIIWPAKGPSEVEKFAFDFTDALAGATIVSKTVTSPDVTVDSSVVAGNLVNLVLSGGVAGTVAKVTCVITTSGGETFSALGVLPIGGEAIDLATAKAAQRIDDADEDALLAGYLRAAIGTIERQTSKNLTAKVCTQTLDGFPGRSCSGAGSLWVNGFPAGYFASGSQRPNDFSIRLWQGPVSEILSVKYDDPTGVEQTLTSFRLVDGGNSAPARLVPAYGEYWPLTAVGPGAVRLSYVAGYDPAALPPELTQAAILLFGHFNANREAVLADNRAAAVELPLGIEMLISNYSAPGIA